MPKIFEPGTPDKPFHFEEMWLAEKGCSDTVKLESGKHYISHNTLDILPKITNHGKAWGHTEGIEIEAKTFGQSQIGGSHIWD